MMKLTSIKSIKGKIVLKTGLHIGAGDMEMHIGGTDNTVVKHPHTGEPYIPGSSLKGKVRALLEMRSGLVAESNGNPLGTKQWEKAEGGARKECGNILKLFGLGGGDQEGGKEFGATRVSFADCPLTKEWREKVQQDRLPLTEVKSENSINRITGTAQNPRFTERVPAGAEFSFSVSLKLLEKSDEELEKLLLEGLKLLEMDALGGSGSRGYGRIGFEFDDPDLQTQFSRIDPFLAESSK